MKYILAIILAFSLTASAQTFNVDGPCDVYYSPKGGVTPAVVNLIDSSKTSIHMLAYGFTSVPISDALVRAEKRGVDVQVILDVSNLTAKSSLYLLLVAAKIPVLIDHKHAIAHNKVLVVDGAVVENGSFNYTFSAENSNGENALICPSKEGAALYLADFMHHKSHSILP
jgi:phosphatidylserine/phosphatidylglycerophosphate/cardiolipin synthase-like enzyme